MNSINSILHNTSSSIISILSNILIPLIEDQSNVIVQEFRIENWRIFDTRGSESSTADKIKVNYSIKYKYKEMVHNRLKAKDLMPDDCCAYVPMLNFIKAKREYLLNKLIKDNTQNE